MTGIDHHLPPIKAQRSKALAKKIPLHDKLADLGMQLRHLGVAVLLAGTALLIEDLGKLLHRLPLPGGYLRRMQFVLARQLRDRRLPLDRFKRDFRLELGREPSARPHGGSSFSSANPP